MIYKVKGNKIEINDELIQRFKAEIGGISSDTIEVFARMAIARFGENSDESVLRHNIEEMMREEITRHKNNKLRYLEDKKTKEV